MANLRANNLTGTGGRNAIDGSVFFDGLSYLTCATSSDFALSGDFTLEMWWKNTGYNGGSHYVFTTKVSNSTPVFTVFINGINGGLTVSGGGSGSSFVASYDTSSPLVDGAWHHIAYTRSSGTNRVFIDGIVGTTANSDSTTYTSQTNRPLIGSSNTQDSDDTARGYISNLRLVKGTALYTANFTPPTEKLTIIPNTILLCCQDSDDPTQEATGKTISAYGGSFQTGSQNILVNGDFADGTTGFIGDSGASISESGGVMTVTNGGGDNLYALAQADVLRIGGKYRCTATVTPTFASGNPVFRVRFGGDAVSFTQQQSTMSTGVAVRIDTGEKVADGTRFEIGSGVSSGITQFTITDLVVTAIDPPIPPKIVPPVGIDEGVTFEGDMKMNSQGHMYFPTGTTEERGGYSGRMIVGGGEVNASPGTTNVIEYLNFAHFSNAVNFGDLTQARRKVASCSSSTRGIWAGGGSPGATDVIDYVTIATQGNAADFGNLFTGVSDDSSQCFGGSNNTRGIFAGGYNDVNTIQYITIASTGNAADFGDLITGRFDHAGFASPTRLIFAGGKSTPAGNYNSIEYVTIATTGGATDFGDMTAAVRGPAGLSNNIRGLMGGGMTPTLLNNIEYVTIATTGNAQDFGDLHQTRQEILAGGSSNNTRGVWAGGQAPSYVTKVDMVMIASMGNAIDFGNLTSGTSGAGSVSDSHGGLS